MKSQSNKFELSIVIHLSPSQKRLSSWQGLPKGRGDKGSWRAIRISDSILHNLRAVKQILQELKNQNMAVSPAAVHDTWLRKQLHLQDQPQLLDQESMADKLNAFAN